MKKIILTVIISVISLSLKAQSEGETSASVGVGIINTGINLEGQRVIKDNIGVAIYVSVSDFSSKVYSYTKDKTLPNPDFDFGIKGYYYLNEILNLDDKIGAYVSVGGGVRVYKGYGLFDLYELDPSIKLHTRLIGRLGGTYNISDNNKFYLEIGRGPSWISGGIKINLKN
ncbi:hypothetical protein EGI22_04140 [Lacihabitans sp. LS3-19]|uniref:hypothetical protein n=1 Tax=Lacihabitans sp. LS3-19 TaxID=2487335 RepID=UPI0020CD2DF0|nr:hypothetical protein [Lacihabitans sp. LS3-19]MCP9767087.1 hypothetical protein [Lacihabitans sp. LS3-19]